jgi:transposase InsO family protein
MIREQAGGPTRSDSGLFWNQKFGRRYSYGGLSILLIDVLRRAGLKPASGRIGPRIHDLRHTMVGHRMREWYPNLAGSMEVSGVDQLWVADITYIRLEEEFVFLAVILDAYSRRVIGWELDRTLEDRLTLVALRMALGQRPVKAGLVHHSDRGIQYASGDYIQELKEHGIGVSMSRKANPWDNAACESFMKTLKWEEVYRSEYRDLQDARRRIGEFLEKVYNEQRLHSALGYVSPVEFERAQRTEQKMVGVA